MVQILNRFPEAVFFAASLVCLTALKVDVDFRREGQISSKMDEGIDLENSKVSMRLYEGTGGDDDDIKIPFLLV